MHNAADSLEGLVTLMQTQGKDKVVAQMCKRTGSLEQRRTTALFIGGLRGHALGLSTFVEQPYGYVASCARCEMICRVPRDKPGIEGRAMDFDCPSGSKSKENR